jgi:hypothetical protein
MSQQVIIYIISTIILAINAYIFYYVYKLNKRVDVYFSKGGNNLEETLKSILARLDGIDNYDKSNDSNIKGLQDIAQKSFQKIGIIKFSPFKDVGGKQSFCLCLLDKNNSGFLITSHFGREFNHIYIKVINKGKADNQLSKEEQKSLDKACGKSIVDEE